MEGYEVVTIDDVVEKADIFITTTGNKDIITLEHMKRMKDKAIVGNIGHFDNEIQMEKLETGDATSRTSSAAREDIKPQFDEFNLPDGQVDLVLAEGRLLNLGCADRPPELRDERELHQPAGIAQIESPSGTMIRPTVSTTSR
jgi:adenosylhomocysteinase